MEFNMRDVNILVSMTLAVLVMTITFNAMGLTNEQTNENQIPEFSLDSGNFNFAGKFPENPGTSSTNFLTSDYDAPNGDKSNIVWLNGDTSGGTQVFITQTNGTTDPEIEIQVDKWNSGTKVASDEYFIDKDNPTALHSNNSYTIEFNWYDIKNEGTNDLEVEVKYNIQEQPESGGGFLKRVPVIGGVMSAGAEIASAVMWIGSVIWWLFAALITVITNALAVAFSTVTFIIDLLAWLTTSYLDLVSYSSSFASIFLIIPGLLMFVEYLKLAFILTDIIWIG
jgi:hypothetical protein